MPSMHRVGFGWGLLALAVATGLPARSQPPVAEVDGEFEMRNLPADAAVYASCTLRFYASARDSGGANVCLLNGLEGVLKRENGTWRYRATTAAEPGSRHERQIEEALHMLADFRKAEGTEVAAMLGCTAIPDRNVNFRVTEGLYASLTVDQALEVLQGWKANGLSIRGKEGSLSFGFLKDKGALPGTALRPSPPVPPAAGGGGKVPDAGR